MNYIPYHSSAIDASGCVSDAWNLVKQNYGLYFGMALLAMILSGCIPCVSLFLIGPITGGLFYVVLREMRGEPVDFGMMFRGFDKFVPLMVIGIVQSIPEIIAQILRFTADIGQIGLDGATRGGDFDFYQSSSDTFPIAIASGLLVIVIIVALILFVVGIVWRVLLFFAIPLAMEHDLGPVDAMKLSAKAAMSNVGGLIVLFILEFLVLLLGVLMICLGVFFVLPIIYAANVFAYRQVFPMLDQRFQNIPPPPDVYGGGFGRGQ
jgi:uncharacterized membrane protein